MTDKRPTDEEILNYEQAIKDEEAKQTPLVCEKEPVTSLKPVYEGNSNFLDKITVSAGKALPRNC